LGIISNSSLDVYESRLSRLQYSSTSHFRQKSEFLSLLFFSFYFSLSLFKIFFFFKISFHLFVFLKLLLLFLFCVALIFFCCNLPLVKLLTGNQEAQTKRKQNKTKMIKNK